MFQTQKYGAIEKALVQTYGIPAKALGIFRGRLSALQKMGLLGPKNRPGKGQALAYGPDQVHRLILACELLEFGIAPSVVLSIVTALWERRLRKIFKDAEDAAEREPGPDDVILHIGGIHLLSDQWRNAVPSVNACALRRLPDHIALWMRMTHNDPAGLPPRAVITNITMLLRAFHRAFAVSFLDAEIAEQQARRRKGK